MRLILKILLLLFLLMQTACEDLIIYDCTNCLEQEPIECDLEIKITSVDASTENCNVKIYQGKVEDDVLLFDQTIRTSITFPVALNSEYTVKATYVRNNNRYVSINSAFPKVDYREDYCEIPCYFIKGNKIDMRIKYY